MGDMFAGLRQAGLLPHLRMVLGGQEPTPVASPGVIPDEPTELQEQYWQNLINGLNECESSRHVLWEARNDGDGFYLYHRCGPDHIWPLPGTFTKAMAEKVANILNCEVELARKKDLAGLQARYFEALAEFPAFGEAVLYWADRGVSSYRKGVPPLVVSLVKVSSPPTT